MKYWSRMVIGVAGLVGGLVLPPFEAASAKDEDSGRAAASINSDAALLDVFDNACADVKNFESLKVAAARKKWLPTTLKSVPQMNRAIALLSLSARRLEIEKTDSYEYSTEIGGEKIFIHIERVDYTNQKYANRCSVHDFIPSKLLAVTELRKWQGRDPDRLLNRSPLLLSAEWIQLPNGAPRVFYYYKKSLGKSLNAQFPDGTHIQIEFSGLRQKV